jgi:hypothetical protein
MREVTPLPRHGAVFFDARDRGRSLRVAFHPAEAAYVLSLWHDDSCVQTFRLPVSDAPELVQTIVASLAQPYAAEPSAVDADAG